jgi:hypothetical protein
LNKYFYFLDSLNTAATALHPIRAASHALIISTFNQKRYRPTYKKIIPAAITPAFSAGVRFSNTPTEILKDTAIVFNNKSFPLCPMAVRIFCASGGIFVDEEFISLVIYPAASHSSLFMRRENIL